MQFWKWWQNGFRMGRTKNDGVWGTVKNQNSLSCSTRSVVQTMWVCSEPDSRKEVFKTFQLLKRREKRFLPLGWGVLKKGHIELFPIWKWLFTYEELQGTGFRCSLGWISWPFAKSGSHVVVAITVLAQGWCCQGQGSPGVKQGTTVIPTPHRVSDGRLCLLKE